ncbi:hypothetical protein [Bradyrhizobium lablabi]|uniref:hypothetical protein n=1 Tax=Bradyrhizobium lablabi TaxID=722472 RepID=UPI0012E35F6B|nr:hypothetical protein [Bradyrhizobium lablabi]
MMIVNTHARHLLHPALIGAAARRLRPSMALQAGPPHHSAIGRSRIHAPPDHQQSPLYDRHPCAFCRLPLSSASSRSQRTTGHGKGSNRANSRDFFKVPFAIDEPCAREAPTNSAYFGSQKFTCL